jgi:hypothetical protein
MVTSCAANMVSVYQPVKESIRVDSETSCGYPSSTARMEIAPGVLVSVSAFPQNKKISVQLTINLETGNAFKFEGDAVIMNAFGTSFDRAIGKFRHPVFNKTDRAARSENLDPTAELTAVGGNPMYRGKEFFESETVFAIGTPPQMTLVLPVALINGKRIIIEPIGFRLIEKRVTSRCLQ